MTDWHTYEPSAGHRLAHDPLNAIVAPRPIGWISTLSANGVANLAPYSFFNLFNYTPPLIGFSSMGWKDSVANIAATGEFVWNLVSRDLGEAIFEKPNCTTVFCDHVPAAGVEVRMGRVLDGVSEHMAEMSDDRTFLLSDAAEPDKEEVVRTLRETETDVLLNYLPVGSQQATEFYADCALEAGVAFVNTIPSWSGAAEHADNVGDAIPGERMAGSIARLRS